MSPNTNAESVKNLCKSILTKLESQKAVVYDTSKRHLVVEELFLKLKPLVFTTEDLKARTLEKMGARMDEALDHSFTESEQFRAARAVVRKSFGDDELNGFYFQKPLKSIATLISDYLMSSRLIDDVFETDEALELLVVGTVKRFDPGQSH